MEPVIFDNEYREYYRYENFNTFVWNLRYRDVGDFQLRTYDISDAINNFYLGMPIGNNVDGSVMQVQNISTSRDSTGNNVVEITGKTLDSVFEHRPTVKKLVSQNDLKGLPWQYGNISEPARLINYMEVLSDLFKVVDTTTYGDINMSYLSLPFSYRMAASRTTHSVSGEKNPRTFYEITPDMNALQVLKDMVSTGGLGYTITRNIISADPIPNMLDYNVPTSSRPLSFVFYSPLDKRNTVVFDYKQDDYSDYSYSNSLHPTTFVLSDTGEVKKYRLRYFNNTSTNPYTGLSNWVDFTNGVPTGLSVYEKSNYQDIYLDGIVRSINEYARNLSITTDGNFPYDYKNFVFNGSRLNNFYLGDVVTLVYPYERVKIQVRVKEFIRTQDVNGYREYPVFEPVNKIGDKNTELRDNLKPITG